MAAVTTSNGNKVEADDDGPEDRLPSHSPAGSAGFFTVYKKGQGYYTRLGTALLAMVLIVVTGLFVFQSAVQYSVSRGVAAGMTAVVVILTAILAWRLMNKPRNADFLIATDSEMKKVNWTSREELLGSTKIVVLFLFVIAAVLFVIDIVTAVVLQLIHVMKFGPLS
ncbi:MAG: preprotein translocase subunit SecE [Tepidisphaeraceae bacterium]